MMREAGGFLCGRSERKWREVFVLEGREEGEKEGNCATVLNPLQSKMD